MHIPCRTRDSSANRAKWIPLVEPGYALIVNLGNNLEMVPIKSLDILRIALPNLDIIHERN